MTTVDPSLKIYVEQLRGGKTQSLQESIAPSFLAIDEPELSFVDPVVIEGEAYLAHEELVVQVKVSTKARIPCRVCNELFKYDIVVPKLVHVQPIEGFKRGYFDISEMLREAILLEVPPIAECHGGHCPSRGELEGYLRQTVAEDSVEEEGYHPFKDLDLGDVTEDSEEK